MMMINSNNEVSMKFFTQINKPFLFGILILSTAYQTSYAASAAPSVAGSTSNRQQLINAFRSGDSEKVDRLLAQGLSISIDDAQRSGLVHSAARNGHTDILVKLFFYGLAKSSDKDDEGNTPLHLAVEYDQKEVVSQLIREGADVDAINDAENAPIHLAAGSKKITAMLIAAGANVNLEDENGRPALIRAYLEGWDDSESDSGDEDTRKLCVVRTFLEAGADVNATDVGDYTVLHEAAMSNDLASISLLVSRGARLDIKTTDGNYPGKTAQEVATACDCGEAADLLRNLGEPE